METQLCVICQSFFIDNKLYLTIAETPWVSVSISVTWTLFKTSFTKEKMVYTKFSYFCFPPVVPFHFFFRNIDAGMLSVLILENFVGFCTLGFLMEQH